MPGTDQGTRSLPHRVATREPSASLLRYGESLHRLRFARKQPKGPPDYSRFVNRRLKWRTGCEGRISTLKRGYGWDRTRIDGTDGARIWTGHGVLAHNLVKIAAHTAPVSTIGTPGGAGRGPAVSISTPEVRVMRRNGFRDTDPPGQDSLVGK